MALLKLPRCEAILPIFIPFPRSYDRGFIEAMFRQLWISFLHAGFHGLATVALLKLGHSSTSNGLTCRFHGLTTVALLKRRIKRNIDIAEYCFHGLTTVALLKRVSEDHPLYVPCIVFPRSYDRGFIEAMVYGI